MGKKWPKMDFGPTGKRGMAEKWENCPRMAIFPFIGHFPPFFQGQTPFFGPFFRYFGLEPRNGVCTGLSGLQCLAKIVEKSKVSEPKDFFNSRRFEWHLTDLVQNVHLFPCFAAKKWPLDSKRSGRFCPDFLFSWFPSNLLIFTQRSSKELFLPFPRQNVDTKSV